YHTLPFSETDPPPRAQKTGEPPAFWCSLLRFFLPVGGFLFYLNHDFSLDITLFTLLMEPSDCRKVLQAEKNPYKKGGEEFRPLFRSPPLYVRAPLFHRPLSLFEPVNDQ